MNILLLASHAVAEFDDLRMFTDMGFDCFAPGGYEVPSRSGEGIRPALPDAPHHPELVDAINRVRAERGEPGPAIDWGKAALPDEVIDWADVIIVHHFPQRWIAGQWTRIRHKRVIWRTCGQSNPQLEAFMAQMTRPLAGGGHLEVVRYSPAERRYFERQGMFAGEDALIRFGKYPDDYGPWTGEKRQVANVTQDMVARGDACGYPFWREVTKGLPTWPAGKGSETIGGFGEMPYEGMLDYLAESRAYLYTGTRPASYTLGLIEAMLSGTPVVCIAPKVWGDGWDGEDLFEGHEIVGYGPNGWGEGAIRTAHDMLKDLLDKPDRAARQSVRMRARAIDLFGIDKVSAQWREFLA